MHTPLQQFLYNLLERPQERKQPQQQQRSRQNSKNEASNGDCFSINIGIGIGIGIGVGNVGAITIIQDNPRLHPTSKFHYRRYSAPLFSAFGSGQLCSSTSGEENGMFTLLVDDNCSTHSWNSDSDLIPTLTSSSSSSTATKRRWDPVHDSVVGFANSSKNRWGIRPATPQTSATTTAQQQEQQSTAAALSSSPNGHSAYSSYCQSSHNDSTGTINSNDCMGLAPPRRRMSLEITSCSHDDIMLSPGGNTRSRSLDNLPLNNTKPLSPTPTLEDTSLPLAESELVRRLPKHTNSFELVQRKYQRLGSLSLSPTSTKDHEEAPADDGTIEHDGTIKAKDSTNQNLPVVSAKDGDSSVPILCGCGKYSTHAANNILMVSANTQPLPSPATYPLKTVINRALSIANKQNNEWKGDCRGEHTDYDPDDSDFESVDNNDDNSSTSCSIEDDDLDDKLYQQMETSALWFNPPVPDTET